MPRAARIGLALFLAMRATAAALEAGAVRSPLAEESLALCARADELAGPAKQEALARGLALATDAVDVDRDDPRAHFAVFCNLAKQMQLAGIGLGSWLDLARARRELDATLALAPDDVEALTAKGALLLSLPRLLGGDASAAEWWLRRALALDPHNATAGRYLVQALAARGAREEAEALRVQTLGYLASW